MAAALPLGWLVAVDTHARPPLLALTGVTVVIGRAPGCAVVAPAPAVSRLHAQICLQAGRLVVVDAGSANGTFVNGRRIDRPHALHDEDMIALGPDGPLLQVLIDRPSDARSYADGSCSEAGQP